MTDLIEKISVKLLSKKGFIKESVKVSPISTIDLDSHHLSRTMCHDVFKIELKIGAEVTITDSIDLEIVKERLISAIKHEIYKDIHEIAHYTMVSVMDDNRQEALVYLDKLIRIIK